MSATAATDLGAVELVTIAEAAALLSVRPRAVYERAESGLLGQVYRDGPRLLVERGRVTRDAHGSEHHLWPLGADR